ncbi:hypothetical protein DDB_G0288925 [Dictyostelium discoideum AX4]|uniref:Uncharacterized protein n=1 Tax=Dictyostelium discoideum TaxID=44689 RepID=Q54I88_DICDI|nr:hypothetical protein DDB_G0288925 [Dictyostelium discoideum AX4]EAL62986.1 hypothetical protein DDB_G0288925 [Dictyostelium discoideum AX4]|eukprot:XP_636491.1 hypothetical protein DDB_G0288925 [Dictyostelium discoideum AX4]
MISRICKSAIKFNNTRYFTTNVSTLLNKVEKDSSVENLDKVLQQVKDNDVKDISIYNSLMQKYSKLNLDAQCSDVFITASTNKIQDQFSKESLDSFEKVLSNHLLEDFDRKSNLDYIQKDYEQYKAALTRKP